MSTNGQLVFTDVDKITFKGVGNTSNAVVDTVTGKIGVGIDSPDANLHVLGNSYVSTNLELGGTLIMGTVNVSAHHSLEAVTAEGNTTPLTVEFSNATTGIVTTGNVEVGNELTVSGNVFFTSNVTTSVDSNVVVEHKGPHSRLPKATPLRKYPEIAFAEGKFDANESTNTYVQAGYTVSSTSTNIDTTTKAWKAFNDNQMEGNGGWTTPSYYSDADGYATSSATEFPINSGRRGEYIDLKLPKAIKVDYFVIKSRQGIGSGVYIPEDAPGEGYLYGSNDGSNWVQIKEFTGLTYGGSGVDGPSQEKVEVGSITFYTYLRLQATRRSGQRSTDQYLSIGELEYYGYEEDPPAGDTSLDATFTSILNTPQTTGANVYVDAKLSSGFTNQVTGPDATGTSTTYDSTGKYWTLTGELTSNVTVEANTFLEGDQPHAVSVWFNSSNLEANTANTCVFTISDQENLDSYNLDLQSNTWHNLTYAYQGEGGSRVTYLDGRKVAEDQAEDTFGDYPPFAMTGYSQGGYVVSANAEESDGRAVWKLFDNTGNTTAWRSVANGYYNADGTYGGSANLGSDSGGTAFADADKGDWVKIELPHKFKLNYFTLQVRNSPTFPSGSSLSFGRSEFIKNGKVWGSNDGISWSLVHTISGTSASSDTATNSYTVTSSIAYKYFGLVVTDTNTTTAGLGTSLSEIELYGHRENDLVRLPDPTNVLKYPHIAMTGPAQRGYVFTGSSQHSSTGQIYSMGIDNGYLFDGDSTTVWHIETNGTDNHRYDGTDYSYGTDSVTIFDPAGINIPGEWVQLEFPHKLQISKVHIRARSGYETQAPEDFTFYGSDTAASGSWTLIQSFTGQAPQDDGTSYYDITSNPAHYKYILMLITRVVGTTALSIAELQYFGTEEATPVPIQIGGGNIDKVANFRVYDKFIGEDQALEIWDAQKDEFGRVKSSMTLHKGRLGIGTTEPEGRLVVADEPDPDAYGLQRIPPKPASGYDTYIDGYGMFQVSSSNAGGGTAAAYWAFDHDIDRNNHSWRNDGSPYTSGTWNSTQTASTTENSNTHVGHWIQLYTPVKYSLKSHKVSARAVATYRQPYSAVVLGSTDGSSWNLLDTWTTTDVSRVKRSITIDNTTLYSYFRLVVKALENTGDAVRVDLGEWELYGIREQSPPKQSVLHDGQLTLTKNLTVPRIGPVFSEYPTPRRNDLLLEYNTALSIHSGDHVIDTSGNSNDGNFYGDATYSEGNRAFEFDGSGDWIYPDSAIVNPAGAWPHSFSMWINTRVNNLGTFFSLGVESAHQSSAVRINSSSVINWFFYTNDMSFNLPNGLTIDGSGSTWYHFAGIYNGGSDSTSRRIWMNGQELTVANPSSSFSSLNIATNTSLRIGIRKNGSQGFNGFISNFRLYNCVLTPNEIFTLYKQGRVPPVHHLQLIDSTMTIGPHSRDPGAHLDVAGHIRAGSQTIHTFTGQHRCFPDEPVEKGLIVSAKKNRFVKLNGFATGQEAITIDESLPIVSLSNVAEDKACFGVVSSIEKPTPKRTQVTNGIISDSKKERGDNRAIVNSVGEGAIWIVNTGGPLESGDYITTSNVVGYGQKQDGEFLANYTVAKITMDCDFEPVIQPVQVIKKDEEGENILDEHGQIQWEDHPTETERAYKVRYLTSDGIQTDEANATHIASFVGCTYHCG